MSDRAPESVGHMETCRYQFEPFSRRPGPTIRRSPRVTLYRTGAFGLNRPAFERLGEPRAVRFLFDRTARAIGIQPASPDNPDAYRVVRRTTSDSYTVRARRFLRAYEVPVDRSLEWGYIREHDGMLVLHLDEAISLLSAGQSHHKRSAPVAHGG